MTSSEGEENQGQVVTAKHKRQLKTFFSISELYEKSRNENFVFDRHLYFIDTEILSIPRVLRPNWINVVRDPIDRFVSLYYYLTSSNDRMPEIVEVIVIIIIIISSFL